MNQTHQVDPKGEEIQDPPTLDLGLNPGVVLDQTLQQRTTVMKLHQIMNPATKSRAESLQPSKCAMIFFLPHWVVSKNHWNVSQNHFLLD